MRRLDGPSVAAAAHAVLGVAICVWSLLVSNIAAVLVCAALSGLSWRIIRDQTDRADERAPASRSTTPPSDRYVRSTIAIPEAGIQPGERFETIPSTVPDALHWTFTDDGPRAAREHARDSWRPL